MSYLYVQVGQTPLRSRRGFVLPYRVMSCWIKIIGSGMIDQSDKKYGFGVDMNPPMGDYGFVVINGDLEAKIDCCEIGHLESFVIER